MHFNALAGMVVGTWVGTAGCNETVVPLHLYALLVFLV